MGTENMTPDTGMAAEKCPKCGHEHNKGERCPECGCEG